MLKTTYILLTLILSIQVIAQTITVPNKKKALLFKGTASWCGPCGYYLPVTENIYKNKKDSVVFINGHVATSTVGEIYSGDMHNAFGGSGIPSYAISGVLDPIWPPEYNAFMNDARNFFKTPIIGNIAFTYSISGSTLQINTTSKFFQNSNGDFFVGASIVENDVTVSQKVDNTYTTTVQERVQRIVAGNKNTIGTGAIWADKIVTGSVTSGSSFNHNLSVTLKSSWKINKIQVVVILWRKNPLTSVFEVVSCEDVPAIPTDISVNQTDELFFNIYPNPTTCITNIILSDIKNTLITVYDVLGKEIMSIIPDLNNTVVNLSKFNKGIYFIKVANQKSSYTKKIILD